MVQKHISPVKHEIPISPAADGPAPPFEATATRNLKILDFCINISAVSDAFYRVKVLREVVAKIPPHGGGLWSG